jgi:hypothetical protein
MEPSKDNPVPTIQYPSADDVHPSREDYDRERKRRMMQDAPVLVEVKIANALDWIIVKNNGIRFSAVIWIILFGVFWFSMVLQMFWLPASLSSIYTHGGYTFNVDGISQLLDLFGTLVVVVFPAYVILYGILSVYESIKRWKQSKRDMEIQAKFGG